MTANLNTATRIYYTAGSNDPWRLAGVTPNAQTVFNFIPGNLNLRKEYNYLTSNKCHNNNYEVKNFDLSNFSFLDSSHCAVLNPGVNSIALTDARNSIKSWVAYWLTLQ